MEETMDQAHSLESGLISDSTVSIWSRNFILICLTNLALFISMQVLTPTLPLYLLETIGNQRAIGYVMAAYTIGAVIMRPLGGWLVDHFGRKQVMMFGIVLVFVVSTLYTFGNVFSLMLLIRCLHGMAFGLVSTALGAMVADSLPVEKMGEGMGYFGLTTSISLATAPIIGFWLIEEFNFSILFLAVGIMSVILFFLGLPIKGTKQTVVKSASFKEALANLIEKSAFTASGVMFFQTIIFASMMYYVSLYANELGIKNIGFFFTANAILNLISRPISGRWMDRGGIDMVLLIGHLALLVGIVTLALTSTLTVLILAGAVLGLGFGCCISTLQALAVLQAPVHKRGAATGTFFTAFDLGLCFGTIIFGYVAEATNYQTAYFTTLIPLAIAGIFYLRFRSRKTETR